MYKRNLHNELARAQYIAREKAWQSKEQQALRVALQRLQCAVIRIQRVFDDWWHHCLFCESEYLEEFEWDPEIPPSWWFSSNPREYLCIGCPGYPGKPRGSQLVRDRQLDGRRPNAHRARTIRRLVNKYLLSEEELDSDSGVDSEESQTGGYSE